MPTYDAALKEAYASAPASVVELTTIEIYHEDLSSPLRFVRDRVGLTATLEADAPNDPGDEVVFQPFNFDISLPKMGEGRQALQLTFDNASRYLMSYLETLDLSTSTPVRAIYRPYLSTDLTEPAMSPVLNLVVQGMTADASKVSLSCGYADFANRKFPRYPYTTTAFPGIVPRV